MNSQPLVPGTWGCGVTRPSLVHIYQGCFAATRLGEQGLVGGLGSRVPHLDMLRGAALSPQLTAYRHCEPGSQQVDSLNLSQPCRLSPDCWTRQLAGFMSAREWGTRPADPLHRSVAGSLCNHLPPWNLCWRSLGGFPPHTELMFAGDPDRWQSGAGCQKCPPSGRGRGAVLAPDRWAQVCSRV